MKREKNPDIFNYLLEANIIKLLIFKFKKLDLLLSQWFIIQNKKKLELKTTSLKKS